MMNERTALPLPDLLQVPLRDVMRGVSNAADVTEDALRNAAPLLPRPVGAAFLSAMRAIEGVAKVSGGRGFDPATLEAASRFARGESQTTKDASACADSLGAAWDHLSSLPNRQHRLMYSEAITVAALRRLARHSDGDARHRAGAILGTVLESGAVGTLPGSPLTLDAEERAEAERDLETALVWLLASRADTPENEVRLLEMASALTQAVEDRDDDNSLAGRDARLQKLAEHL